MKCFIIARASSSFETFSGISAMTSMAFCSVGLPVVIFFASPLLAAFIIDRSPNFVFFPQFCLLWAALFFFLFFLVRFNLVVHLCHGFIAHALGFVFTARVLAWALAMLRIIAMGRL